MKGNEQTMHESNQYVYVLSQDGVSEIRDFVVAADPAEAYDKINITINQLNERNTMSKWKFISLENSRLVISQ